MQSLSAHFARGARTRIPHGQESCGCCNGTGEHMAPPPGLSAVECRRCDAGGTVPEGSKAPYCPQSGRRPPRRRHWRQASHESMSIEDLLGLHSNEALRRERIRAGEPVEHSDASRVSTLYDRKAAEMARHPEFWSQLDEPLRSGTIDPVLLGRTGSGHVIVDEGAHRIIRARQLGLSRLPVSWDPASQAHRGDWDDPPDDVPPLHHEAMAEDESYRISHRPMEIGAPIHNLAGHTPEDDDENVSWLADDYLTHPQYYSDTGSARNPQDHEAISQMRRVQGHPDALVTVYRASHHDTPARINHGDWVTLSKGYAHHMAWAESGENDLPEMRWVVRRARVPAKHVRDAGSGGYREQGYWGPDIDSEEHTDVPWTRDAARLPAVTASADRPSWRLGTVQRTAVRMERVDHILSHYRPSDFGTWDEVRDNFNWGTPAMREFVEDVRRNGVTRPVPVDYELPDSPLVKNGHMRILAAERAGVAEVPVRQHEGFMDPDDPDPMGCHHSIEEHQQASPHWQREAASELPYLPPPDDDEINEHITQRHELDPENLRFGDARHWQHWHRFEHTRTNSTHQHDQPDSASRKYPDAYWPDEELTPDTWGYSGGHRTPPGHEDIPQTGEFIPLQQKYSALADHPGYGPEPERHYAPEDMPQDERVKWNDRIFDQHRVWKQHIKRGLSLGHLSTDQAKDYGYFFGGHETDRNNDPKWQPLPQHMYHVTTDLAGVREHGLKTRDELAQIHGGHGLGGGEDDTISVTTNRQLGGHILNALHEFHRVVNGKFTPKQMWEQAKRGYGAEHPYHEDLAQYWKSGWKEGDEMPEGLRRAIEGTHRWYTAGTSQEEMDRHHPEYHARPAPDDEGWMSGHTPPRRMHAYWVRDMSPDERRDNAADFYKHFAVHRQLAGGPEDPMFFATDTKAFAAKNPKNFALLHVQPRPGAQGYPLSGMHEWRTGTGDALHVTHFARQRGGQVHEAATDWNEHHPAIPGEIHRGLYAPQSHGVFAVPLSDEDIAHGLIAAHQEEHFPYRRDQHELFGTHWTSSEDVARNFAEEHETEHHDDDQCPDHDDHCEAAPVVFHAQRPERHEIETDPRRLGWQNVDDYDTAEHEVPIRHGAPVRITGVSWLKHTGLGPLWHRHNLREPVELRAEDRDSPDDPNQWNASLKHQAVHCADHPGEPPGGTDGLGHQVHFDPGDGWHHLDGSVGEDDGSSVDSRPVKKAALDRTAGHHFEDQGDSPLDYRDSTWLTPKRVAITDPEAGEHPKGDIYFAETPRMVHRNPETGRRDKTPKKVITPGAAPGTVSFADYTRPTKESLYINYMKTRADRRGQGLSEALVDHLISQHPDASYVDFGRMMHPSVGRIKEKMQAKYPDRHFHGKVFYASRRQAVLDRPRLYDKRPAEADAHALVRRRIDRNPDLAYRSQDRYGLPPGERFADHYDLTPVVHESTSMATDLPYRTLHWGISINGRPAAYISSNYTGTRHKIAPYGWGGPAYDPALHGEPQPSRTREQRQAARQQQLKLFHQPHEPRPLQNPHDGGQEWYHGSPHEFHGVPEGLSTLEFEDNPYDTTHWNSTLGSHWTANHAIARRFSSGTEADADAWDEHEEPKAHVIHARLAIRKPKVYGSEHDMDQEVYEREWKAGNHISKYWKEADPESYNDVRSGETKPSDYGNPPAFNYFDDHERLHEQSEGDPYYWQLHRTYHPYATGWLNAHPHKYDIARRYRERLQAEGYDGIVYQNEFEKDGHGGGTKNRAAIAFHPGQVHITQNWIGGQARPDLSKESALRKSAEDTGRLEAPLPEGVKKYRGWMPTERIFGPTHCLDHRLFEDGRLKPEVRNAVLERITPVLASVLGPQWREFTRVYLAGSEASLWTNENCEGNGDFDTLVGIDHDHAVAAGAHPLVGEAEPRLNAAFNERYNEKDWHPPFDPQGTWDLTAYANPGSYDIRKIRPYAAYDITNDRWAVRPPELPEWGPESFPQGPALFQQGRALIAEVRAILRLPEPFRSQEAKRIWDYIHEGRKHDFTEEGLGWMGTGNALEKMLDQASGNLVGKLKDLVYNDHDAIPMALGQGMTTRDVEVPGG